MHKGHVALLSIIADGGIHSGEALASKLNVSRAAIWKSIKHLESLGLPIEAVQGKGYSLKNKIELFSEEKIASLLKPIAKSCCNQINVLFKTSSTNSYLLERLDKEDIHGQVVLAEYQSGGRGRRGNQWVSPLANGLYISLAWRFDVVPGALGLLSLFAGVAVARTLTGLGLSGISLKWPNDIVVGEKKIGGILLDLRGEAAGPVHVIIGIGINYDLPQQAKENIDQANIDICSLTRQRFSRNEIVASLLSHIFEILKGIETNKNLALVNEWRSYDCYVGRKAKLLLPNKEITGILKGVDDQGALLMDVNGKLESYTSGEVSLRVQQ